MDISKIDKNFSVSESIENGTEFHSCLASPFRVYGLIYTESGFVRMPEEVSGSVSDKVLRLSKMTAGGRVRFATDSPYVSVKVKMRNVSRMSHFSFSGSAGLDIYADGAFAGVYIPPYKMEDEFSGTISLGEKKMREILIDLPLYSGVVRLDIGVAPESVLKEAKPYSVEKPVIFYGSSITQGGCASRPGTSYQSVISRRLDCDFVNLGFSGAAKGEKEMAEYVASLDMSVFVYDYDHNAPDADFLEKTHEKMFLTFRRSHPTTPVIMLSKPFNRNEVEKRRDIIRTTYENAVKSGDKNVVFLDGLKITEEFCGSDGTVDGNHPNDLGFAAMARAIGDELEKALEKIRREKQ